MFFKIKKMRYILNFSIFTGIVPAGISDVVISNVNDENIEISNKNEFINENTLKFGDKYISLRSNPMNNFVSLTTTKVGNGNIKEQFTYVLCDTATSQEGIKYGKNSGVVKLDYQGNVKALWTLPNTDRKQENEYIYTTNIVFGDTEETVYVLCGISNPVAALNSVYGNAKVPTKINYDENANLQDKNTAYFYRNKLHFDKVFERDLTSKYKVDIVNYSFANYPKIKIYKLDANDLTQSTKYDFEFPPAEAIRKKGVVANEDEYDKTIIAGFGGGQHLNYWSTNSTWITNYQTKNNQSVSLMNSSFFHYLQFGQTFDYVGNERFMMVPKYIGIDPNLGGLYSIVNEELTGSVASLSSYPSLYDVLYKYKGKPRINTSTKTLDFSIPTKSILSCQYQYLNGLGEKVDVCNGDEFALKESVINLILLSIGYFLPDHEWSKNYDADMTLAKKCSVPSWLLNTYGIVCFSPIEAKTNDKYILYVFDTDIFSTSQFIIDNVFITKDTDNKKRYRFFLRTAFLSKKTSYADYYNADGRDVILFGSAKNLNDDKMLLGFTWNEFVKAYRPLPDLKLQQYNRNIKIVDLTGVNGNSKDWSDHDVNKEYYDNLSSVHTVRVTEERRYSADKGFLSSVQVESFDHSCGFFSNSSGSKYIVYGDNIIISDPVHTTKLVVANNINFVNSIKKKYGSSYQYSYNDDDVGSIMSFNRISTLFPLSYYKGFGYLTYKNDLKICLLTADELQNKNMRLVFENFKSLFLSKKNLSVFQSVIPVGKMLFTSTLNKDKTVSSKHFDIEEIESETFLLNSVKFFNYDKLIIWIVIGTCIALVIFIVSTYGIVVLIRKKEKLQLAAEKLSNKKIDMLSTTVVKSFKKFNESANISLKNQPKALYSIVFNKAIWSSPMMLKLLPKPQNKPTEEAKIITKLTNQQQKASKHLSSTSSNSTRDLNKASK